MSGADFLNAQMAASHRAAQIAGNAQATQGMTDTATRAQHMITKLDLKEHPNDRNALNVPQPKTGVVSTADVTEGCRLNIQLQY